MKIGIGGVSRSGKTFLTGILQAHFTSRSETPAVLHQDDFAYPASRIPKIVSSWGAQTDWESPDSMNFVAFEQALLAAAATNSSILAEGFLVFYKPELLNFFDKKIFIEIEKPIFWERKKQDERWGILPEWYFEHIWQSYEKYGKLAANLYEDDKSFLVLDGSKPFNLPEIVSFLEL
jgi:nicotinamide/nicotinate riboside kinase